MTTRTVAPQGGYVLRVDAAQHTAEVARFTRFVVRGPGSADCWLWTGAIADDGYGRFWLHRNGDKRVVRPHRYALARHRVLTEHDIVMHEVCDTPLCVRAEAVCGHLEVGTQPQNLAAIGKSRPRWWPRMAAPRVQPQPHPGRRPIPRAARGRARRRGSRRGTESVRGGQAAGPVLSDPPRTVGGGS